MQNVIEFINQNFDIYLHQYDFKKYPSEVYNTVKNKFSKLNADDKIIKLALEWKWGHIGKTNYPTNHKKLIKKVTVNWEKFNKSNHNKKIPKENFNWWYESLANRKQTRFITVAYIIHLIHYNEIPIIDQHNYRALNYFLNDLQLSKNFKKKPSRWNDIIMLKQFTDDILPKLSNTNADDFDKFLMMFGKSIKNK